MHKTMIGLALVYLFLVTCVWSVPIKVIDELDFHATIHKCRGAASSDRKSPAFNRLLAGVQHERRTSPVQAEYPEVVDGVVSESVWAVS